MGWIGPTIAAAGQVAGGLMGSIGQANLNIANRDFANAQAIAQRNWESQQQLQAEKYNTWMSDTAMQRRVDDLKKAGINPLFGITAGAASAPQMGAPSGAMASTPNTANPLAPAGQGIGQAGSTYFSTANQVADIANKQAQTDNTKAQTDLINARLPYASQSAAQDYANLQQTGKNLKASMDLMDSQWDMNVNTTAGLMQNQAFQRQLFPLTQELTQLDIQRQRLGLPALEADASFWKNVNPTLKSAILAMREGGSGFQATTGGVSNAASLLRMLPIE